MPTVRVNPPDTHDIASFYDETLEQRLRDYVHGNDRITAAFELAASLIDGSTKRVLEVGCGLGISAVQMVETRDWVKVHAVDISPKVIDAASKLFGGNDRLTFEVSDMREVPRLAPYDLITLLDVYEHIPREDWPQFNAVLGAALSTSGTIVITVPSRLHQEHLARVNPSGLQIVDQVVELEDLAALAKDVEGILVYFAYVSVWNSHDYIHSVIRRGPEYQPLKWRRPEKLLERINKRIRFWFEKAKRQRITAHRLRTVHDRLGITLGEKK